VYDERLLMMDRGTVEFYSKNKFEKLVHLFGFIVRIYHDARSPERQIRYYLSRTPTNVATPLQAQLDTIQTRNRMVCRYVVPNFSQIIA